MFQQVDKRAFNDARSNFKGPLTLKAYDAVIKKITVVTDYPVSDRSLTVLFSVYHVIASTQIPCNLNKGFAL